MKKRLFSILLAAIMVFSLLPVTAFATGTTYDITNGTPESAKETNHGYIAIDKATAAKDEIVTITVNPATGYQLKSLICTPTGFVDLGIKDADDKPLYWKETNLGASNPQDPGDYYMWGATALMYSAVDYTKTDGAFTFVTENPYGDNYKNTWDASLGFNVNNVPFADGVFNSPSNTNVFTKYTTIDTYAKSGTPDNFTTLKPEDDAATAKNANWHTPTYDEFFALRNNCVLVWTDNYNSTGNAGYIVYKAKNDADKGKKNSEAPESYSISDIHIFLPAAGYGNGTKLENRNRMGSYCSSNLNTSRNDYVGAVGFNKSLFNIGYNNFRDYGFSIRPVMSFSGITPAKNGTYQFTMPAANVTVTAEFETRKVAKIGDTGYATLKEAVTAANYGDTITLLTDVTTNAEQYYGIDLASKAITLDLDGYTLSSTKAYAVNIAGANVTIKNGTVKSSDQTAIMVNGTNTTLTLDSVTLVNTHTNQNEAHYSLYAQYSGGSGSPNSVIIKGNTKFIYEPNGVPQIGEFYIAKDNISASVEAGAYNFDPTSYVDKTKFWVDNPNSSINEWKVYTLVAAPEAKTCLAETDEEQIGVAEGRGYTLSGVTKAADKGSYTAYATPSEGYVWVDNHGTEKRTIVWSIAAASAVAKIGETEYATLARAYKAANAGDTITLLAGATAEAETYGITIEESITLNLNGKTLSSTKYMGVWVKAGNVTIKNGTITGSGTITLAATSGANLTLDGVTLKYTGSNTPYAALNTDCNSLTIKGNTMLLDKDGNVGAFFINSQNKTSSVEAGTYNFDPAEYVDSTKYYVDNTNVPSSYVVKPIAVAPEAKTGLVENDTEQTGVEEGEDYTLTGTTKATAAGEYTAYATPATGYVWSDGTTAQKEIKWSIAQSETVAKIGDTEFKTLAGALKAAQSGGNKTVTVVGTVNGYRFDGNYDGITIQGSETGKITGNFTAAENASLNNVKFLNLKFEGCGIDFSNVGLQFENAVIQGCTFDGTGIPAEKRQQAITINVHHADKLLINNNTIKNYTSADSSGSSSAILLGTVSDFNGFVEGHSVTISNNEISNIAYNAIQACDLSKVVISNNTISDAKKDKGPINLNNTKKVEISGNTITLAEGYKGVYYNVNKGIVTLSGNTIKDSNEQTLTFDETLANVNTYVTGTGILVLKGETEADDRYIAVSDEVITAAFPGKNVVPVEDTHYTYALKTVTAQWTSTRKVYTGSPLTPDATLDGLVDGTTVIFDEDNTKTEAGSYQLTASLNNSNYKLTNPNVNFVIEKAPVTFTVTGDSQLYDGNIKTAIVTAKDNNNSSFTTFATTYKNSRGETVAEPKEVGNYGIYVEITNNNYRHADATDGAERKIGTLSIYQTSAPATYTVSFEGGEGATGSTAALGAAKAGDTRILPACGFTKTGWTFTGWKYGGKVYKAGESFTQPAANVTFTAQWTQNVYTVGGVVKNHSTAKQEGAVVTLMSGARRIEQVPTDENGAFSFTNVLPGLYNLVVSYDGMFITTAVKITDANVSDLDVKLPNGKTNSVVEVAAGTPEVVVGGLEKSFTVSAEGNYKTEDAAIVRNGGSVEFKLTVSENSAPAPEKQAELAAKSSNEFLYLDMDLSKTTIMANNTKTTATLYTTDKLLEITIPIPAELQGKDSYQVYRYHKDDASAAETLTQLRQLSGTGVPAEEGYRVSADKTTITVYTKSFSLYAITYQQYSGGGSSSYSVTVENAKHGTISVDKKNTYSGNTVTITVTPDKGFTLETLTVLNKNGKEIEVKNLGNNKYSFKMPSGKVTISATFMEDNSMLNFFVDVKADDYFYDAVLWAAENDITKGTDAVHFSPNMGTTRAQVVTFLWRAAGCPEPKGDAGKFVDVPANEYYAKAVAWAIEQVITKGTSDTTFSPDVVCTRAQIVTFLARFAGVADEAAGYKHGFTDVKAADYFNNAVAWAKDNKVTEGTSATTFSPNTDCTRAQVVTFLYRWMVK